jgi:hypothetical protein
MKYLHRLLIAMKAIGLILILGGSMSAHASNTWKEEVLLHDGTKLIAERTQSRGGSHELGQEPPIKESTLTFSLPDSHQSILWKDEFSKDVGHSNFNLLALHVLKGVPYIVTSPAGILSYNKWNRPNPPYVIFRYDGNAWYRITLEELPKEFEEINLVVNTLAHEKKLTRQGLVSHEMIKNLNSSLTQEKYKAIVRIPINYGVSRSKDSNSGRLIRMGDGGWMGLDWFANQPSLEACLKKCKREKVRSQDCPCKALFKGK